MNTNPNLVIAVDRAFVANLPAAPAGNATAVLFASHPCTLGTGGASAKSTFVRGDGTQVVQVAADAIEELDLTYHLHDHASAANGLRFYETTDGGVTWTESDMKGDVSGVPNQPSIGASAPIQVPALSAGQEWSETFEVGRYRGFAITHTAGTTGPTAGTGWSLTIAVKYAPQGD